MTKMKSTEHHMVWWDGTQWREQYFTTESPEVTEIVDALNEFGVHAVLLAPKKQTRLEENVIKGLLEQ